MSRPQRLPSGLYRKKSSDKAISYFVLFDLNHKRHYSWLGTIPVETAKNILEQMREQAAYEASGLTEQGLIIRKTFSEHFEDYKKYYADISRDNRAQEQNLVHYLPFLGSVRISAIQKKDIEKAIKQVQATGKLGPCTLKKSVHCLSGFFKWLINENIIKTDPVCNLAKTITVPDREYFLWHPNEDLLLLKTMKTLKQKAAFLIAIEVGARIEAVRLLKKADVHFRTDSAGREYVKLCLKNLKGGKKPEWKTSYSRLLIDHLKQQHRASTNDYLLDGWRSPGPVSEQHIRRDGFQQACEKVFGITRQSCKDSGRPYPRFHDIRHVFVTRAKGNIANEQYVMAIASHESETSHSKYEHLNSEVGAEDNKGLMATYADAIDKLRQLPADRATAN